MPSINNNFISNLERNYIIHNSKYTISDNITIDDETKIYYNQREINKLYKHIKFFVNNILNKYIKCEYWAIGGTLLGIIRHGGLIPWDNDADFAITLEGFNFILHNLHKINKIFKKYNSKYELLEYFNGYKLFYKEKCIVDLFVVDCLPEDNNKLVYSGHIDEFGKSTFLQYTTLFPFIYFLKKDIFPLKKSNLCDFHVNIPNNAHEILYNNYSKTCLTRIIPPPPIHNSMHESFMNSKKSIYLFEAYKYQYKKYSNVIHLINYCIMLTFYKTFSKYKDDSSLLEYKKKLTDAYNDINFINTFFEFNGYCIKEYKFILRLAKDLINF
jgi:hypothetical protein